MFSSSATLEIVTKLLIITCNHTVRMQGNKLKVPLGQVKVTVRSSEVEQNMISINEVYY